MAYNGYIYKHTSPSGKVYIGQTTNTPTKRWGNGKNYQKNTIFGKAIQHYGWGNFSHEVIELVTAISREELYEALNRREEFYIKKYNSTDRRYGYNILKGGANRAIPPEVRQKISLAHKGKPTWNRGLKGIKMSEETKRKISRANRGKPKPPFTQEHRDNIGKSSLGRTPWNKGTHGIMPTPKNKGCLKYPLSLIYADIQNGLSYTKIQKKYDICSTATITKYKRLYVKKYGGQDD